MLHDIFTHNEYFYFYISFFTGIHAVSNDKLEKYSYLY